MAAVWLGKTVVAYRCVCGFRCKGHGTPIKDYVRSQYPKPGEIIEPFVEVV
jgi:hypothetical protein